MKDYCLLVLSNETTFQSVELMDSKSSNQERHYQKEKKDQRVCYLDKTLIKEVDSSELIWLCWTSIDIKSKEILERPVYQRKEICS